MTMQLYALGTSMIISIVNVPWHAAWYNHVDASPARRDEENLGAVFSDYHFRAYDRFCKILRDCAPGTVRRAHATVAAGPMLSIGAKWHKI